jgi:hydrogenase maturation protease
MRDLREQLEQCFDGRVGLVGVGNVERGDDGLGVRLAEDLRFANHDLRVVVAGTSPERYLTGLKDGGFNHVIFLDAVEFGGAPGTAVFLDANEMASRLPQVSTHKISLGTLAQWIEAGGTTRAWLLGVQPASLRPGMNLSPTVERTLEILSTMLTELAREQRASVLDCGGPPPLSHEAGLRMADTRAAKTEASLQERQGAGALQDATALSGDVDRRAQSAIGNRQSAIPSIPSIPC